MKMMRKQRKVLPIGSILSHIMVGTICFYIGLMIAMSTSSTVNCSTKCQKQQHEHESESTNERNLHQSNNCPICPKCLTEKESKPIQQAQQEQEQESNTCNINDRNLNIFPETLSNFMVDYSTIPRNDFIETLDIGVPWDDTKPGSEEVLILHTASKTIPKEGQGGGQQHRHHGSTQDILNECNTVKVILQPKVKQDTKECIAIVPQWESYYIHNYMKLSHNSFKSPVDNKYPLRYVSRTHSEKGSYIITPKLTQHIEKYYPVLTDYLLQYDTLKSDLIPITKEIVESKHPTTLLNGMDIEYNNLDDHNTIIVLVCNKGQSELLHNFICNSNARNLPLNKILVFATDEYTYDLVTSLGLKAYYNKEIFGDMPENAANAYGDRIFARIMMAKVYCVHLINALGYNVLFQDVDVIWYKYPLTYFWNHYNDSNLVYNKKHDLFWDLIFQDDGARSTRYAPYSPNTGFYYVRANEKTQFFFSALLRYGDVIQQTTSHQAALTSILQDHVSWKGLRVKVLKKGQTTPFPGGNEYHRSKIVMKTILQYNRHKFNVSSPLYNNITIPDGYIEPYIFHMSWTQNKMNKKLYFQQMGEWYLQSDTKCEYNPTDVINQNNNNGNSNSNTNTINNCCLVQPEIICYYRDKPSLYSCKQSPPIDKGRPSFW